MPDQVPADHDTNDVGTRLTALRQRIATAVNRFNRDPASVHLVAVSKTKPVELVEAAHLAGQKDFGENYLQDALTKIKSFGGQDIHWHFIGDIQSNKTRDIANHFDWAHAVDRFKIARRLSEQRPGDLAPLNVCIQVNIDGEPTKAGVRPDQAEALASQIAELPGIRLRGLMAIPAYSEDFCVQRQPFAALRELRDEINSHGHDMDVLSMGMSSDIEAAIAEGATHVRVGTAIFGPREK